MLPARLTSRAGRCRRSRCRRRRRRRGLAAARRNERRQRAPTAHTRAASTGAGSTTACRGHRRGGRATTSHRRRTRRLGNAGLPRAGLRRDRLTHHRLPALPNVGGGTAPDEAPSPLTNPDWKLCVAFANGDPPPPRPCGEVDADGADGTDGPPDTALPDTAPLDKGLPAFVSPVALPNDDDNDDDDDGIDAADDDGIDAAELLPGIIGICDTPPAPQV